MFSFQAGYGIGSRFQLFVGYRGLYTATHSPYGGVKVSMFASPKRSVGLSFIAMGGWTYARREEDDEGNPIGNARYVIILPDGEQREGTLDGNGFVRIDGIPPGRCTIDFPESDGSS